MPISRDDVGFLFWPDAWGTPSLGLETGRLQKCIDEVLDRGLNGAFGRHPEFQEADLSCFLELPQLTSVELWDIRLTDISAIYSLPKLTHFRISGKRPPIDFGKLASVEHHKRDLGISSLSKLKVLNLWRFKAESKTSFRFELPDGLEELGLFWSNVDSLKGFGVCPEIRKLEVARCRNLKSLGDLKTNFPKLEHLVVDACGRLTADEAKRAVAGHRSIRHAFAGNQLIVSSENQQ